MAARLLQNALDSSPDCMGNSSLHASAWGAAYEDVQATVICHGESCNNPLHTDLPSLASYIMMRQTGTCHGMEAVLEGNGCAHQSAVATT